MSGIGKLCSAVEQADPQQLTDDIAAGRRAPLKNISTARTRYDDQERLQYIGRTNTLPRSASAAVAGLLTVARAGHPWTGWSFSAAWGSRDTLDVTLVEPVLVVEVGAEIARDTAGRWRHPRTDLTPADIPHATAQ
ncbi:hypothetical protein ACIOHS_48155 [Streptomyces sp. NPDC088253]|uniref:hypothetical protein n=1 Tax=Streptomyces sp. NPDC088253 TaxID=3365846 RepID=UPI00381D36C9